MPQKSQRLKKSRRFKKASQKWLLRQINDDYVERAKSEGWRSRAAFKIIEIDEKFKIFKKNKIVVDLGSAPGGWSQYAVKKVGDNRVLALDILEMPKISGVEFMQMDFLKEGAFDEITSALGQMVASVKAQAKALKINAARQVDDSENCENQAQREANLRESKSIPKCNIVLTDMAANTTGNRDADHLRIINLLEESLLLAEKILLVGGSFVGKIFQGGSSDKILQKLRQNFSKVHYFKPNSSRKESSETYLVALGYKSRHCEDF